MTDFSEFSIAVPSVGQRPPPPHPAHALKLRPPPSIPTPMSEEVKKSEII